MHLSPSLRSLVLALVASCAAGVGGGPPAARNADADAGAPAARDAAPAFTSATTCALCHATAPAAQAMRLPDGSDVSPHRLWSATPMAHAAVDPFWRAQVAAEVAAAPEHAAELEALCTRCHAPVPQREAAARGEPPLRVAAAEAHPLGREGVTCTFCHQVLPDGLGTEATFSGKAHLGTAREIFGPYEAPFAMPMRMHSGFTPVHGPHVRDAGLCGTCHTLFTQHVPAAGAFPEQTPYLEWLASGFADGTGGVRPRTCQQCHMPNQGSLRIARNPGGRDFPPVGARPDYAAHRLVGGNARLLDLLSANADELGVTADPAAIAETAAFAREQLATATARVSIGAPTRDGGALAFDVRVENLAGHKFPTGYPARRAWLEVEVLDGERALFHLGRCDAQGRLVDAADERALPHVTRVTSARDLVVYELVALDEHGAPTTLLARMARVGKDTRLLPRGWRAQGPYAATTAPVGVGDDHDFGPGGDTVAFRVPLPADAPGGLTVRARLRYQTMHPAWVDALRAVDDEAARRFTRLSDALPAEPEVAGSAERREG